MVTHDKYADAPRRAYAQMVDNLGASGTTVRVALMGQGFSPGRTSNQSWTDVSADEIDPANNDGYTSGGTEIGGKSLNQSSYTTTFNANDAVWADSSISAYYAVVYNDTPSTASDKDLLTVVDFEGEEVSEVGEFRVEWDAAGVFQIDTQ